MAVKNKPYWCFLRVINCITNRSQDITWNNEGNLSSTFTELDCCFLKLTLANSR